MSYTVDANILLYASDESSAFSAPAQRLVDRLIEGPDLAYLFWPVLMAYLRIATHPAIFDRPLPPKDAVDNVDALVSRRHVRTPGEDAGFWASYRSVAAGNTVRGNSVPDAHLVALMRQYGVDTICSEDRDFHRFTGIRVQPLR